MSKKQVVIELKSIEYIGDNIGDDIRFRLTIDGRTVTYNKKIKNGAKVSLSEGIIKKLIIDNVNIPVHMQVVEKDPVSDDIGSGSGNFQILCNGADIQTYSLRVLVSGDRNKKAEFIFQFEATLETAGIKYVNNVSTRGWLSIKHEDALTSPKVLPFALKVQVTEIMSGREYFIIEEGHLQGHKGSVRLADDGTSYLTEADLHTSAVHLVYSKQNEILQVAGTNKAYWAVLDPTNPIPNGVYDIEIPDEPHPIGEYYERYSIYAKTWFRIGHVGDRYLHFGQMSLGCLTVKKHQNNPARWDEIYNLLITSRKGDQKSVGTVEVGD